MKVSAVYNSDNEASIVYVMSASVVFNKTVVDGKDTYTLATSLGDDFASISYKNAAGGTLVVKTESFTSDTWDGVKVSTVDGLTLDGAKGSGFGA